MVIDHQVDSAPLWQRGMPEARLGIDDRDAVELVEVELFHRRQLETEAVDHRAILRPHDATAETERAREVELLLRQVP